jgi:hypothetical protein
MHLLASGFIQFRSIHVMDKKARQSSPFTLRFKRTRDGNQDGLILLDPEAPGLTDYSFGSDWLWRTEPKRQKGCSLEDERWSKLNAALLHCCFRFVHALVIATVLPRVCSNWRKAADVGSLWHYLRERDHAGVPAQLAIKGPDIPSKESYKRCLTSRLRLEFDTAFEYTLSSDHKNGLLNNTRNAIMDDNWLVMNTHRGLHIVNLETYHCVSRQTPHVVASVAFIADGVALVIVCKPPLQAHLLNVNTGACELQPWDLSGHTGFRSIVAAKGEPYVILRWADNAGFIRDTIPPAGPNLAVLDLKTGKLSYVRVGPTSGDVPRIAAVCCVPGKDMVLVTIGYGDSQPYQLWVLKPSTLEITKKAVSSPRFASNSCKH